jgi:hypothetical protein
MSRAGRPQEPLDPSADAVVALAHALREARHRSCLTLRQVAEKTNYSVTTCTAASRGKELPTWQATVAFTRACGGDEDQIRALWEQAALSLGRDIESSTPSGDPPDPSTASTAAEFMESMVALRTWAQLSLRALNLRSDGHNKLPPSTVSETLKRSQLPDVAFVFTYVKACGLTDDQAQQWFTVWDTLNAQAITQDTVSQAGRHLVQPPAPDPRHLARALRRLVGVNEAILDYAPHERNRHTRRGFLLLISTITTGTLIGVSGAKLFTNPLGGITAGLIGALVVLYIVRQLIASLTGESTKRPTLRVVPGLLMAILLGMLIAEPLLLSLFQTSIGQQVQADRQRVVDDAETMLRRCNPVLPTALPYDCSPHQISFTTEIDQQRYELKAKTARLNELQSRFNLNQTRYTDLQERARAECNGMAGIGLTGIVGQGPRCRKLGQQADQFFRDSHLQEGLIAIGSLRNQSGTLETRLTLQINWVIDVSIAKFRATVFEHSPSLLEKERALNSLMGRSVLFFAVNWLLRLLLVGIPLAPLIATWLGGASVYRQLLREDFDRIVQDHKARVRTEADKQLHELLALTQTINDLVQQLPGLLQHRTTPLDINTLLASLVPVQARLTEIADPKDEPA